MDRDEARGHPPPQKKSTTPHCGQNDSVLLLGKGGIDNLCATRGCSAAGGVNQPVHYHLLWFLMFQHKWKSANHFGLYVLLYASLEKGGCGRNILAPSNEHQWALSGSLLNVFFHSGLGICCLCRQDSKNPQTAGGKVAIATGLRGVCAFAQAPQNSQEQRQIVLTCFPISPTAACRPELLRSCTN